VLDGRLWLASERMEERHRDEWELVHGAHGVEELPSQLEQRHAEERARLDALIGRTERGAMPEPEHSRAHGEFLSPEFAARNASEHLAPHRRSAARRGDRVFRVGARADAGASPAGLDLGAVCFLHNTRGFKDLVAPVIGVCYHHD
jgi:hypothetical protein